MTHKWSFDGHGINDRSDKYAPRIATLSDAYKRDDIGQLIADAPTLLDLLAEAYPFVEEAIDDETNAPNGRARIRKLSRKIRAMIEKHDL